MKLQKRLNRIVGNKEYSKWVLTLPSDKIEEVGWSEGDEIDAIVKRHEIILKLQKQTH